MICRRGDGREIRLDELPLMRRVLYNDWEWWGDRADDVNERFSAWLAR